MHETGIPRFMCQVPLNTCDTVVAVVVELPTWFFSMFSKLAGFTMVFWFRKKSDTCSRSSKSLAPSVMITNNLGLNPKCKNLTQAFIQTDALLLSLKIPASTGAQLAFWHITVKLRLCVIMRAECVYMQTLSIMSHWKPKVAPSIFDGMMSQNGIAGGTRQAPTTSPGTFKNQEPTLSKNWLILPGNRFT